MKNKIRGFHVVPIVKKSITFLQVVNAVNEQMNNILSKYDSTCKVTLKVGVDSLFEDLYFDLNRTLDSVGTTNHEYVYFYLEEFGRFNLVPFDNTPLSCLNVLCGGAPHLINYDDYLLINIIRKHNKKIKDFEQKALKAIELDRKWNFHHGDESFTFQLLSGLLTHYTAKRTDGIIWSGDDNNKEENEFPVESGGFNLWCFKQEKEHTEKELALCICSEITEAIVTERNKYAPPKREKRNIPEFKEQIERSINNSGK